MTRQVQARFPLPAICLLAFAGALAQAQPAPQALPNLGQQITPEAPRGSRFEPLNPGLVDKNAPYLTEWLAGQAASTAVSPDHKTLLVLTSGYNRVYTTAPSLPYPWNVPDSNEYVFVYDISTAAPIRTQVLQIANTYFGIAFDPSGKAFYVAGGPSDNLHIFDLVAATPAAAASWVEDAKSPIALNHVNPKFGNKQGVGLNIVPNGALAINSSVGVLPCAAGVALSTDGQTMVVANYYNDSITVFTGGLGNWTMALPNLDLRPGKNTYNPQPGVAGGEYPFWVVVKGTGANATAYVSSIRDREVDVVRLAGTPEVTYRIRVKGQPNKMALNAAQTLLYVVEDQTDTVDVVETTGNTILESIPVLASVEPSTLAQYTGANPNSVALSPDETQLYVTNGNLNCIAVIALSGANKNDQTVGLIPTGWYPNSVSFSGDGNTVYVVNAKSPTGANPGWCYGGYGPAGSPNCNLTNLYNPQQTKAGFQSFPRPNAAQLAALTTQVAANNHFSNTESASDAAVMAAVRQGIQHVIFIIRENRTYDQILGDLEVGNGDPDLAMFGEAVTPNAHNLARTFVTLDNFMDSAEVSYDGWLWSTSARAPDVVEHQMPVAYAYRGTSLDSTGLNRNVNVAIPALADRIKANPFVPNDPDVLPGQTNVSAPDGPNNELNTGFLWDNALRNGLTVRNYGFFIDETLYSTTGVTTPEVRYPAASGTVVAVPSSASLAPFTDPYFRGFDNSMPDYYRYMEWAREFDGLPARQTPQAASVKKLEARADGATRPEAPVAPAPMAALSLVRLMHDHTGNWTSPPLDGVDTPEKQIADNDYAVGLLIEKVSKSAYANNTLIFVIEDDSQDGGDHVDSHRSVAFVAGAYVKQGALVSTPYNTINFIRTIEEVLGLPPMNLNDALARPMADIFTTTPNAWSFTATPSAYLYNTALPLPPQAAGLVIPKSKHDVKYWARVTRGMDFTEEDRVDPGDYNHILWKGLMGRKPYPEQPTGANLRENRAELLARYRQSLNQKAAPAKTGVN
jgi:DNA-binding beta-propeller fold protein YncE